MIRRSPRSLLLAAVFGFGLFALTTPRATSAGPPAPAGDASPAAHEPPGSGREVLLEQASLEERLVLAERTVRLLGELYVLEGLE